MASSIYNKQILALQAAASINGNGASDPVTYGCSITRTATGTYKLILPTGEGLSDPQTFTQVAVKGGGGSTAPCFAVVSDEADTIKTVVTFNASGVVTDSSVEVYLQRSTVNPF